jgi:hypothetical protein
MECFDIRGNGNCIYNLSEESLDIENKNTNKNENENEKGNEYIDTKNKVNNICKKDMDYLSNNITMILNDLKGKGFLKYFEEIDKQSNYNDIKNKINFYEKIFIKNFYKIFY